MGPTRVPDSSASVPVRVFDGVAPAPFTPAPRWWNHPVTVTVAASLGAAALLTHPVPSPLTGLLIPLTGCAPMWSTEATPPGGPTVAPAPRRRPGGWPDRADYRLKGHGQALAWAPARPGLGPPRWTTETAPGT